MRQEITNEWLESINIKYRSMDIHPGQRPWLAIEEWSKINNLPLRFPSISAQKIFEWFEKNTQAGSQEIGPLYQGAYYFDSSFWSVYIPLAYGTVKLNALYSLKTMPQKLIKQILSDKVELERYMQMWIDSLDYAYGFDDLDKNKTGTLFGKQLLRSGNRELTACVPLLLQKKANPKSVESARMATEMFLKMFLAYKTGLTAKDAKKTIGHNIITALDRCAEVHESQDFESLKQRMTQFPSIEERYSGKEKENNEMWNCYLTALMTGATIIRILSGRDNRPKNG